MKKLITPLLILISTIVYGQTDCDYVDRKVDKFTSEIKFSTPIQGDVYFLKVITPKGNQTYYVGLRTKGASPVTGEGVIILLENGEKISRPNEKTSVRVTPDAEYEHSAFFALTLKEVETLKKAKMTDAKLYIFEMSINNPKRTKDFINCLSEMK